MYNKDIKIEECVGVMNEEKNKLSKESKKQTVIMALIAVVTLLLVVIGATYAFFASQNTGKKDVNINAESGTTDVLTFESGKGIDITANMENFAAGMTSVSQTTNPKATLRANDATKKAEEEYNVYLVIDENGLIYTDKENKTPELLLQVKTPGPNGSEIKDIPGLKYYENVDGQEGVSGFDITNKKNAFAIYEGYKISVGEEDDGVKVDTWEVTVTLVNFQKGNQNDNTGRNFHARIVMTKGTEENVYKLAHINTVSTEKTTDSIIATLDITDGTKEITEYWFGIESKGEVVAASEEEFNDYHQSETGATYTFNGLKDNTNYVIHSYVVDEEGFKSNVYETEFVATNKLPKILTATATVTSYDTIEVKVTGTENGTNPISNYRYQIETNDEIMEDKTITKAEPTHTFNGLTELTQYKIIINAIDSNNKESNNYEIDVTTRKIYLHEMCTDNTAVCQLAKKTTTDAALNLHSTDYLSNMDIANKELNANDSSYRYSGSNDIVNNYVCLDGQTTKDTCNSEDDLYRIIGLFPNDGVYEMKLIKAIYGNEKELGTNFDVENSAYAAKDSYAWNNARGDTFGSGSTNMWQYSNLNEINLNDFYYDYITTKVSDLSNHITGHKWTTGGFDDAILKAQEIYNFELGTKKLTTNDSRCYAEDNNFMAIKCQDVDITHDAPIGLMYVSDYGFAAYPEAWGKKVGYDEYNDENITKNNWMYTGIWEWTISRTTDLGFYAWYIDGLGSVNCLEVTTAFNVRPVFYLDATTKIAGGEGTHDNPYRLKWN